VHNSTRARRCSEHLLTAWWSGALASFIIAAALLLALQPAVAKAEKKWETKIICTGIPSDYGSSAAIYWTGTNSCEFDPNTKAGKQIKRVCGELWNTKEPSTEPPLLCQVKGLFQITNKGSRWVLLRLDSVRMLPEERPAAKLPKAMLGTWCVDTEYKDDKLARYERGDCHFKSDGWMILRQRTRSGHETDCKVTKTTLARDFRLGGEKYMIQYRCRGEGDTWNEHASFSYDGRREFLYQSLSRP
jgi:hypothetical protein